LENPANDVEYNCYGKAKDTVSSFCAHVYRLMRS